MNILILAATILTLSAITTPVVAHGVRTEVAVGAMTVVTFTQSDGSPIARAPFTVTAPGLGEIFLAGSTDIHGRVVFLPDQAGAWKVFASGADGHGAVVTIDVDSTAVGMVAQDAAAIYAHEHAQVEVTPPASGHEHAAGHEGEHEHDAVPSTLAGSGAGDRRFGAVAGVVAIAAVFAAVFILLRRRAG